MADNVYCNQCLCSKDNCQNIVMGRYKYCHDHNCQNCGELKESDDFKESFTSNRKRYRYDPDINSKKTRY